MTAAITPAASNQSSSKTGRVPKAPAIARLLDRLDRMGIAPAFFCGVALATVLLIGRSIERASGTELLTLSAVMTLSWLGLGPLLIRDAVRLADRFLHSELVFASFQTAHDLFEKFLENWHRGRLLFSILWSLIVTTAVLRGLYSTAPDAVRAWAAISYGLVFFISGIGFWGVVALVRLVKSLATSDLIYRPYHPDRFGGMAAVGSFSVRGALYFSSGALALPLAFETIGVSGPSGGTPWFAYVATATFMGFVCAAFLIPIMAIKQRADDGRIQVSLDARDRLQALISAYAALPAHDEKLARQAEMCFQMECAELDKLREYPYDLRVLAELLLAVAVPVAAVLLEALLG